MLWSARLLGVGIGLFLAMFALDAWEAGAPISQKLTGLLVHLLPSALVLSIVVLSWNRPWIGGIAFVLLAAAYAATVGFRLDWMLAISGPLLIAGGLFLWSWRADRRIAAS
jgi:hypothetical protein